MSEYRKKAEECLRAAKRMRDPAERIEMLGIARGYMTLADHADRSRIDSLQQKGPDQVKWGPADRGRDQCFTVRQPDDATNSGFNTASIAA